MNLRFEKLQSPIYPAFLHVGEYSIPIDPDRVQSLKEITRDEPAPFLEALIEKVGYNRYLKELLREGISKAEEPSSLTRRLQEEIRSL